MSTNTSASTSVEETAYTAYTAYTAVAGGDMDMDMDRWASGREQRAEWLRSFIDTHAHTFKLAAALGESGE
jgi:hypothetical protein